MSGGGNGRTDTCMPYSLPKCDHHVEGPYGPCPPSTNTPSCEYIDLFKTGPTSGQGQKSQRVVQFPFLRGCGVNFSGGYPRNFFSPAALIIFDSTFSMKYQAVSDFVSPVQANIFINSIMKGQNQAIGMILRITI